MHSSSEAPTTFDHDLIVIGGGSGGMACAKEAARLGSNVCLFDFVKPSTQGSKWGLGGTCVNVGCVPKKLMHYASLMNPILNHDASRCGWKIEKPTHHWPTLVQMVQNHIRFLNFNYRNGLRQAGVKYLNKLATLKSPHEIIYESEPGQMKILKTKNILLAVGGRPIIPDNVEGAYDYAITSDDIFSLKHTPGKTLVVGGSYIALESAGFLFELGFDVTVAVRSILLRGFDRQCSEKVGKLMEEIGVTFKYGNLPKKIEKLDDMYQVTFQNGEKEVFKTIMYATGRRPDTSTLGLEKIGMKVEPSGKIKAINEQTHIPSIFVIGDIIDSRPELTPVAIRAGELLARRLFGNSLVNMNYDNIPTTVFTPYEYGCCGLSEEEAIAKYGNEDVEVYLQEFSSLEMEALHREKVKSTQIDEFDTNMSPCCLLKLICIKSQNEKVIGFHFVGPNAGDLTQGIGVAIMAGCTKSDFDACVGIHPTAAEAITSLSITRRSGESWVLSGGCGGGKCG